MGGGDPASARLPLPSPLSYVNLGEGDGLRVTHAQSLQTGPRCPRPGLATASVPLARCRGDYSHSPSFPEGCSLVEG